MKKTKHFNSKIYETEKKIKTAFIILVVFLIGLYIGVAINYMELQNKEREIREYQVEIDSLKEVIYLKETEELEWNIKLEIR